MVIFHQLLSKREEVPSMIDVHAIETITILGKMKALAKKDLT